MSSRIAVDITSTPPKKTVQRIPPVVPGEPS
jgi:hypothetical protein